MIDRDDLILIGSIGKPHGFRGEVKVRPETDDPDRYVDLERVFVGATPETARELALDGVRFQYPKGRTVVLLGFAGIDDQEGVEALRGNSVYALQSELPALADGEVYVHDLIGLTAVEVDADGAEIGEVGTVRDVFEGAQLLYQIRRADGSDVLLPDVDAFIHAIDVEAGKIFVRPPEGIEGIWDA